MGTRPEVIKMAPVVKALRSAGLHAPILATAQHRQLLDQTLQVFQLASDWDLDAMRPDQGLSDLVARLLPDLERIIRGSGARLVLAQGDTTTVFCAALAAFHARVPFGHVEAGLRSGDLAAPFPEEANRRLATCLSALHFAPTYTARLALLREGVPDEDIHVVGNTVIDALLDISARPDLPWPAQVPRQAGERMVLITLHRRENFGEPLQRMLKALRTFALQHPDTRFVYPLHPNPHVKEPAQKLLGDLPQVHLLEPVEYGTMVALLRDAYAVFTDSGGLQEEAPALGKPVLLFREVTERPEAVEAGGVRMVGSDPARFAEEAHRLWTDPAHYAAMATPRFPYGDGRSSERITALITRHLDRP
jgi:UDP-N-acetylglucosamine 2-epimerase (non-hydrolysing)